MTSADWEAFSESDLEAFRVSNADKMDVDWEDLLALEDFSMRLVMSHVPTVVPNTDVEDLPSTSTSINSAPHVTLDAGDIDTDPVYTVQETGHPNDDLQEDEGFPWFSKYCLGYYYGISQPVGYHTEDDNPQPRFTPRQVLVNNVVRPMSIPTSVPTVDIAELPGSPMSHSSSTTLDHGNTYANPVPIAQETRHFVGELQGDDVFPWFSRYNLAPNASQTAV